MDNNLLSKLCSCKKNFKLAAHFYHVAWHVDYDMMGGLRSVKKSCCLCNCFLYYIAAYISLVFTRIWCLLVLYRHLKHTRHPSKTVILYILILITFLKNKKHHHFPTFCLSKQHPIHCLGLLCFPFSSLQKKVNFLLSYLNDLTDQNQMLVQTIEDLQGEADGHTSNLVGKQLSSSQITTKWDKYAFAKREIITQVIQIEGMNRK